MVAPDKHVDFRTAVLLRWVLKYARRRFLGVAAILVAMLLRIVIDVLRPWPMKVLVDNVLEGRKWPAWLSAFSSWAPSAQAPKQLIIWCVVTTVFVFFFAWLLRVVATMAAVSLGQRVSYDLAGDLFRHLQRMSLRFHSTKSVGDLIRRVLTDSICVATIVKDVIVPVVTSTVSLAVMFVILWRLNSPLTLVSLAVVPLMALAFWLYAKPMAERQYEQQQADGRVYQIVERHLSAVPVVHAFCREQHAVAELRTAAAATVRAGLVATSVQLQFKGLVGLATALGTAAIVWIGARQVMAGHLTVGGLLVFLSYLASLYAPLEVLAYSSSTVQTAAGSARRVYELLATHPEVRERPLARSITAVRGEIRLDDVTVGYRPGEPALHNVSLSAAAGETIAIVGPTGAGKSTLVSLIPRFMDPWQGRVTLDGYDLRDLRLSGLRRQVSLVLQDPFLFPMTVAENIGYGRPGAGKAEVEAAARAANAHEFIKEMPAGYDTLIGQRGATLSGGERQRISIARALLKDAPVLILDEPTSALDVQTEGLLLEALARLKHNRTTFIIAHRLSTIRSADRIVTLEAGRVVETGSHAELIAKRGLYARLYECQFGKVIGAAKEKEEEEEATPSESTPSKRSI